MIYARHVIGVLDVQSSEKNAFGSEDITVLSTLADQITVAIQNARSLEETRRSLVEAQSAVSRSIIEAWKVLQPRIQTAGYQLSGASIQPLQKPLEGEHIQKAIEKSQTINTSTHLVIPIRLRNEVIGVINLQAAEGNGWSPDQVDIAEAVAARLSLAIEASTLLHASQRRASIERITADITGRISASTHLETILQTAAQELSRALGGSDVLVQIEPVAMKLSSSG
jgi:GAF domain-containing protein